MMFTRLVFGYVKPCLLLEISQHYQKFDTSIAQVLDPHTGSGLSILSTANLEYDPTMSPISNQDILQFNEHGESKLSRSYALKFVGVWGGANGHVLFFLADARFL